eukprot:TRINITY_DN9586_c0_g1_i1.p1 TRINITY_DN9586_c0_g1~~TRINITY_DN9586_c0_g1_i1.p1  ORF type:complete len:284 (-),score=24.34 TRINITY_DN9586_c0_g1_i1:484-1335(-)
MSTTYCVFLVISIILLHHVSRCDNIQINAQLGQFRPTDYPALCSALSPAGDFLYLSTFGNNSAVLFKYGNTSISASIVATTFIPYQRNIDYSPYFAIDKTGQYIFYATPSHIFKISTESMQIMTAVDIQIPQYNYPQNPIYVNSHNNLFVASSTGVIQLDTDNLSILKKITTSEDCIGGIFSNDTIYCQPTFSSTINNYTSVRCVDTVTLLETNLSIFSLVPSSMRIMGEYNGIIFFTNATLQNYRREFDQSWDYTMVVCQSFTGKCVINKKEASTARKFRIG